MWVCKLALKCRNRRITCVVLLFVLLLHNEYPKEREDPQEMKERWLSFPKRGKPGNPDLREMVDPQEKKVGKCSLFLTVSDELTFLDHSNKHAYEAAFLITLGLGKVTFFRYKYTQINLALHFSFAFPCQNFKFVCLYRCGYSKLGSVLRLDI